MIGGVWSGEGIKIECWWQMLLILAAVHDGQERGIFISWKIGVILSDIEVGIERSWSVRPRIIVLFLNQREINLLSVKSGWLKLCRCSVDLKKL